MKRFCLVALTIVALVAGAVTPEERVMLEDARSLIDQVLSEEPQPTPTKGQWGTNLSEVQYYGTNWPFRNVFKTASEWKEYSTTTWRPTNVPPVLDENGWIRELRPQTYAISLLFRQPPNYPAGDYIVTYDGEGKIWYRFSAQKKETESIPGRDVIAVTPSKDGIGVALVTTNPDNPIRNIRVYLPGEEEGTGIFRQQYLDFLEDYSTLRFMDWMHTNWSPGRVWEERAEPEDATYTTAYGVPVEVMCALANELDADPWFCIPHLADNDYVQKFATVVKNDLESGQRAYFEYTNEVWNGGFGQASHCRDQGLALGLGTNNSEARAHYYSRRSVEIFDLIEGVYGGTDGFVRVLASQAANLGVSQKVLAFEDAYQHADVLAIAPYFGGGFGNSTMTLEQLLATLKEEALPQAINWMQMQKQIAAEHGLILVAYEGGQHLVAPAAQRDNQAINTLYDAANRADGMEVLYRDYLSAWKNTTDGVFVHFTECGPFTKYGRWGSIEYLGQEPGPKARALKAED